ncbi:methylosome protein WDR77-like [Planococcus citri]|uniref:methylosome protein WDR77-like n=1 Tax=Planococcus citri TaxID=170843 RepID=UPI0031F9B63B
MDPVSRQRSTRQLDFIAVSKENEVLVGASNLLNSGNWNGDLIYFGNDQDVPYNEDVFNSTESLKHYLPFSVCDGTFIEEKKIIVGNDNGMLCIYSISASESTHEGEDSDKLVFYNNVCTIEHDRSILSLSVSSDRKKVATASMDRSIKLWDIEMFVPETTFTNAHSHFVTCVNYKPETTAQPEAGDQPVNHVFVSTSLDGRCLLWDSRQQFPAQVISTSKQCGYTCAEWFDNGDKLFLGCDDGTLSLFDIRNTSPANVQNYQFSDKYLNRIVPYLHNNEKYIAICEDSSNLKVFRYKSDNSLDTIYSNSDHKDYVKGLSWLNNPTDPVLLSCAWDSRVLKHYPLKSVS